jgi:hypothetical protein
MRCLKSNGTIVTVTWRLFYPNCANANLNCRGGVAAYLSAATICSQGL